MFDLRQKKVSPSLKPRRRNLPILNPAMKPPAKDPTLDPSKDPRVNIATYSPDHVPKTSL